MRKSNTGSLPVTPSRSEVVDKDVGKCSVIPIKINGVEVFAMIDTGSGVSNKNQSIPSHEAAMQ